MGKYNVVLTGKPPLADLSEFQHIFDLKIKTKDTPDELWLSWLSAADAVFSTGNLKIDEAFLAKVPRVKVIAQSAAGYDNIDVTACSRRGILVGNTPGIIAGAVADIAYGLILCSARYLHKAPQHVISGEWSKRRPFVTGIDLNNKLLGIIGLGTIGLATAKRARASGMRIAYHNRRPSEKAGQVEAEYLSLEELLGKADFVLLSLPLTKETRKMFGDAQFALMKPEARFINIGRGALVDTDALCRALQDKKIAYAALDVTDPEPLPPEHPLLKLDNALVFPHIGTSTHETRAAMALLTFNNIKAALTGVQMPSCVNRELEIFS